MEIMIFLPLLMIALAGAVLLVGQAVVFVWGGRLKFLQRRDRRAVNAVACELQAAQRRLNRRGQALKASVQRLAADNTELTRLNMMKNKFLLMAAHDVRSPLSVVAECAKSLEQSALDKKQRKYSDYIQRATGEINSMLDDITEVAVIESGKFSLHLEAFDMTILLEEVAAEITFLAQRKGVSFGVAEALPVGTEFYGDRPRISRVLINLLGNAVDFTPQGGSVELRAHLSNGRLNLSVKDSGLGVHAGERGRIFDRFYQSRHARKNQAPAAGLGVGLGLTIAKEIVCAHGGQIGVDSPGLGKGSTFWVRLPVRTRRTSVLSFRALAAAAALLALGAPRVHAQPLPLEDKTRYEEVLERKANDVLQRMIGANRYKITVDATLDFTRIERFESHASTSSLAGGGYLWGSQPPEPVAQEILPGMPAQTENPGRPSMEPQSYERSNIFPSEFIKRLAVTVVLDSTVEAAKADDIRAVLTDILGMKPRRGDRLNIVRSNFLPAWQRLWYEPGTLGTVIKYSLCAFFGILALIVGAVCLMRLSNAMSDMANAQSQQVTMDLRSDQGGGELDGPHEGPGGEPSLPEPDAPKELGAAAGGAVHFDVRPGQVEALAGLLAPESVGNIALICAHLDPAIRAAVLARIAPALSAEILVHMGSIHFVEQDIILKLKEEIESKLAGAVGGPDWLAEMIGQTDLAERARMLGVIAERDAALASQLKGRLFLLDDLTTFTEEAWSYLLPKLTNEEWVAALMGAPEPVILALKDATGAGQWRVLGQLFESAPPEPGARFAAQRHLVQEVEALERAGRVVRRGMVILRPTGKTGN